MLAMLINVMVFGSMSGLTMSLCVSFCFVFAGFVSECFDLCCFVCRFAAYMGVVFYMSSVGFLCMRFELLCMCAFDYCLRVVVFVFV